MPKKVNIIGAGLAGLSAGIYLQESGVETEIFELAGWAGGMCTTWVRNGFKFDGCIHWMVGMKPDNDFYNLYREIDALEEDTQIYCSDAIRMELDGTMYEIPMEISKFQSFLLSLSPQDSKKIEEFCKTIDVMIHTKMPSGVPDSVMGGIRMLGESKGFLSLGRKYLSVTIEEYAAAFQSAKILSIIYTLMPKEYSMVALLMMLGTRMSGNAGYPKGGALDVIKRIQAKYLSLGGKINFNTRVEEIVVENGKAVAVRTKNGLTPADAVIAACDAYDTINHMLNGKFAHPQLDPMLKSTPLFPPLALVSFGLNKQFGLPDSILYESKEGIQIAPGARTHSFHMRSFEFDPTSAPENCSSIMVMLDAPLEYWQELRSQNIEEYRNQKQKLANEVAEALDQRIPGFKDSIVVTDVSTPATYVRVANLYQGSFEGFAPIPAALKTNIKKTIPGLKNFCICGQWTNAGGGICTAVRSGKDAANLILKEL